MNNFSKKISFILSIMMLALMVLPVFTANAATTSCSVTYNSKVLPMNKAVVVKPGSKLKLQATGGQKIINFVWDNGTVKQVNASSYELEIGGTYAPSNNNEAHYLYVSASNSATDYADIAAGFYRIIVSSNYTSFVSLSSTLSGKAMTANGTYQVVGGETFSTVGKTNLTNIAFISYYICNEGESASNVTINKVTKDKLKNGNTLEIKLPTYSAGTEKLIFVEAVDSADVSIPDDGENRITKTGWIGYKLKYVSTTTPTPKPTATPTPKPTATPTPKPTATPTPKPTATPTPKPTATPTPKPTATPAPATKNKDVNVSYGGNTLKVNTETSAEANKLYYINVTPTGKLNNLDFDIQYKWDDASTWLTGGPNQVKVEARIPSFTPGTTHKLHVRVHYSDNTYGPEKIYIFKIPTNTTPAPSTSVSSKMNVEPWMEVNDELEYLAINLRNDSEKEGKANKNIYALNETVTYYLDYRNGSNKDITSEVTIRLELPSDMSYDVISTDGGTFDSSKNIITWKFKDGLERDEDGTLIVKVKYTAFPKKRNDSKVIYPLAVIFNGSKEADNSAVINMVIVDYDTEIDITHEPYMYGDLNADTFRPNDGISRAEGALVLARIYGLDYLNTKVTNLFTDLDDTYLEAQKAIIACAREGIIKGYSDGSFKPNEKMTRAQFMSLLARMIQMTADDDNIDGLEVKDVNRLVKVYADNEYTVRGRRTEHWALKEVTMLARLNMTHLSKNDDELELDKDITRAEVAQLVNFYLLRAPASTNSRTDSGFSDVRARHALFADIIEATREAHTFSIDSDDGTERAR